MNRRSTFAFLAITLLMMVCAGFQPAWSQATGSYGSIEGTISDPQGAAEFRAARVSITSKATGALSLRRQVSIGR